LPRPLFNYIPGFEYLVRAGWTPDGTYVWCQLITRTQNRLELILIPVANFQSTNSTVPSDLCANETGTHDRQSPCIRLVVEEDVEFWVKITFVWASHRSGFSHLYLMQRSWASWSDLIGSVTPVDAPNAGTALILDAEELFTAQLTSGSWEVTGEQIWLDETHQLVYFEANREHPLLRNIYAVSYACSTRGRLIRLTPTCPSVVSTAENEIQSGEDSLLSASPPVFRAGQSYFTTGASCFDPTFPLCPSLNDYPLSYEVSALDVESGWAVLTSSSLSRLPGTQVVRIVFQSVSSSSDISISSPASTTNPDLLGPTRMEPSFRHVAWLRQHVSHHSAASQFIRPCDPPKVVRYNIDEAEFEMIDPSQSNHPQPNPPLSSPTASRHHYPQTFLYGLFLMHAMLYCHFGYAVFLCDCRGSANRGILFAGHIKDRLGQVELNDHVAFLKHVANSTGLIDMSRVAITGYSYGGYMSLMAAMHYSHIYRAVVACSPVVDWIYYDTAYTERYLGLPRENPTAYW
uniref:Peptidase_S9 domain-containing protein n=1 Tax=Echinostoma caproni TaxID=27848 RepID=A0A183AIV1_9TREM